MRIVADENIPLLDELFGALGSIQALPGRNIDAIAVEGADALLVRSVTPVDQRLLENSSVRFVGTCTIGTDHIDTAYLNKAGIAFASAPGCNADAVVQYVLSVLASTYGDDFLNKTIGIVGAGQVGGRLAHVLAALGVACLVNDPPLQAAGVAGLVSLDEVFTQADAVSLHVPLNQFAEYPSFHLVNAEKLTRLREGALLINSGRGAVVDNLALADWLASAPQNRAVLDVWEGEPEISLPLLAQVGLGTPHIAGYSLEGKMRGTWMIYQALCRYLGHQESFCWEDILPAPCQLDVNKDISISGLIRQSYDVSVDDKRMRQSLMEHADTGIRFDQMRKTYYQRREFASCVLDGSKLKLELKEQAKVLGMIIK